MAVETKCGIEARGEEGVCESDGVIQSQATESVTKQGKIGLS